MDALYQLLRDNGAFDTAWRELDDPPIGGSSQNLDITVGGAQFVIPVYVIVEQQEAADRIFAGIRALVPDQIWGKLNMMREDYVREHE